MASDPTWYAEAARRLAAGATIVDTATAVGVAERTLRRHLDAPVGTLKALVDAAKAEAAEGVADELGALRGKALRVLEQALDNGDVNAAKALLQKLVASPADAPAPEAAPEEEISAEDAAKEMALAFPAIADLARQQLLSSDAVEQLRAAARAFLADDLQPRPPPDLEADRVDAGSLAQEAPAAPPVADGGAAIIPIR